MTDLCCCLHWRGHHEPTTGVRGEPDYGACTKCKCRCYSGVARTSRHRYQRGMLVIETRVARLKADDRILVNFTVLGGLRPADVKGEAVLATVREVNALSDHKWGVLTDLGPSVPMYGDTAVMAVPGKGKR